MEQCAPHAAAATLVRESGDLYDDRDSLSAGAQARVADISSGAPLRALGAQSGAKPSRCVPKCGERDGAQTADMDGELPLPHRLKAVSSLVAETDRLHAMLESGGRPAVVVAGVSRHPDGDSAGAPEWQLRGACVNVSSGLPDIDDSPGWPALEATSA